MPIYAYKCACCQHELDVLQKISDPPLTICPRCGAAGFAKQLTAAGFQLKGSGWYVTDFKNGSAANAKAAAKPEEAKSGDSAAAPAKEPATPKDAPAKEPATPKDAPAKASSTAAADGAAASSN